MGFLQQFLEGGIDSSIALQRCLERIEALDPAIRAWVEVAPRPPRQDGPLSGVPYGAKDIFETEGMSSAWGSPLFAGRKGTFDATIVRQLEQLGAILLGKTQTTAFAYYDPGPTRNPRDLNHTPGGSSSGSAAAVAAGMVPFALGTQTQGSVIRPAAFCGVAGFKPAFGAVSVEGVLPFAPSLDTVGFFTQDAADMAELWTRLGHERSQAVTSLAVLEHFAEIDGDMRVAMQQSVERLRERGFSVTAIEPPDGFDSLLPAVQLINRFEGSRTHEDTWRSHGDGVGAKLHELIETGLQIPNDDYIGAIRTVARYRMTFEAIFRQWPVVLTPAAPGTAPRGLESTGDPCCNAPWTGIGSAALTVPIPRSGLPLGLQLTAAPGNEAMLLATGIAIETAFSSEPMPQLQSESL